LPVENAKNKLIIDKCTKISENPDGTVKLG
jgi:hypothetical protein